MAISVAIILALLALAFVAYPFFKGAPVLQTESAPNPTQELERKHDTNTTEQEVAAKTALQEVELDYQLGNINDPDYQTLRERYMQRALIALKARYDEDQTIDALIEEQLRMMREQEKESEEDAK